LGIVGISFVINLVIGFIVFAIFTLSIVITIYTHKKDKERMTLKKNNENN